MTEYKSKVKYEAPIEINIEEDFPDYGSMAVSEIENMICSAVLKVGITVDKEELIKALRYDRGQYEKGYADGKRDADAAIEALQAAVESMDESCKKQLVAMASHVAELQAAQPHWVSVKERFPECGKIVLIQDEFERLLIAKLDKEYRWLLEGGGWIDTQFTRYWMPIEPPQEVQE